MLEENRTQNRKLSLLAQELQTEKTKINGKHTRNKRKHAKAEQGKKIPNRWVWVEQAQSVVSTVCVQQVSTADRGADSARTIAPALRK
jgi:hypothetical protein